MLSRREFLGGAAASLAAAEKRPPNILLLLPDQHRFDWTSFNQDLEIRTPHLDRLAREGMRFTQALVASPLCAPSRACLAAGKEYDGCRVPGNKADYPLDQPTVYQLLRDAGYHVMGCGKFDLHKASYTWGLDGKHLLKEWGFSGGIDNAGKMDAISSGAREPRDPYMAYLRREGLLETHVADFAKRGKEGHYAYTSPTPLPEHAYCDNWVAANGIDLVRRAPAGRPWFLQVNFTGPHSPMDVTARMEKTVIGRRMPPPHRNTQHPREKHALIRQNYTAMIENIDRWAGELLAEIAKRGESANTLVAFSSDHGDMLGDHDKWGKTLPWHPSVAVPFLISGPSVKRGEASDALVSQMDLAATFLDFAGIPRPAAMDSRSLRALLEGKTRSHREAVLSGLGEWRLAYDGRYKLIREKGGRLALYDRRADPHEDEDIAAKAKPEVERLSRWLPPQRA